MLVIRNRKLRQEKLLRDIFFVSVLLRLFVHVSNSIDYRYNIYKATKKRINMSGNLLQVHHHNSRGMGETDAVLRRRLSNHH